MAHLFSAPVAKKRRRSRSGSADFATTATTTTISTDSHSPAATDFPPSSTATLLTYTSSHPTRTSAPHQNRPTTLPPLSKGNDQQDEKQQQELPVHAFRDEIVEAIAHNPNNQVILITASTGSGKSTQIPSYFLSLDTAAAASSTASTTSRLQYRMAVTQPRRVAAITLAQRVAAEYAQRHSLQLNQVLGKVIGYRVRFDDCTHAEQTQLAYVTDGMLLREAMVDPLLSRYNIVFLDEAHERSLQTDILMGVVHRARHQRQQQQQGGAEPSRNDTGTNNMRPIRLSPLTVVIMSATLQVDLFANFFGPNQTRTIQIPGRLFPVQVLYTEEPQEDYMEAALATILQIHEHDHGSSPPLSTSSSNNSRTNSDTAGDILVFLPGQEEIEDLASLLKQHLASLEADQTAANASTTWTGDRVEVLNKSNNSNSTSGSDTVVAGVLVCVLYAALPADRQLAAFAPKPAGCRRKIVLATNIAETSVTLPDIRYVIDTGKHKIRHVAASTGMECLMVGDISQAQAAQRTGRAGRVQSGFCFRLFPEHAFDALPANSVPEILRVNLAQVVLQLKGMGIADPATFDFITPPDRDSLHRATRLLYGLSALDDQMQLTDVGRNLSKLPLDPTYAYLLLQSANFDCVKEMLTVVSVLSAENLFYMPPSTVGGQAAKAAAAHRRFASHEGDLPTFLNVYTAWQREAVYVPPARGGAQAQRRLIQQNEAKGNGNGNNNKLLPHGVWCQQNFISGRSLSRAYNVRQQLQNLCARSTAQNGLGMNVLASCGGSTNDRLPFLKCLAAGLFMQAASRIVTDRDENGASKGRSGLLVSHRGRYRTKLGNNTVSVHPASMMFNRQPAPKCVVYTELVVTKKTYIRGVTQIREEWLQEAEPKFYNA